MPLVDGPQQLKQSGRSSKNTLAYMGVAPESPSNFKTFDKDPTPQDYKNWEVGDEWENRVTKDVWKLVAKNRTGANTSEGVWVKQTNGLGNLSSLKDTAGTIVVGDAQGTISINGGELIDVTAGVNSLDINFSRGLLNGQIPIASMVGPTQYANITAGANINITEGPNSITISSAGGGAGDLTIAADGGTTATSVLGTIKVQGTAGNITATGDMLDKVTLNIGANVALKANSVQQVDADAGSATPAAGILDIVGGQNINTSAAGSTVTVNVKNTYKVAVAPATLEIGTVDATQKLGSISIADLKVLLGLP
jgi:hypothetical protein